MSEAVIDSPRLPSSLTTQPVVIQLPTMICSFSF
jgi:hypothetical protein